MIWADIVVTLFNFGVLVCVFAFVLRKYGSTIHKNIAKEQKKESLRHESKKELLESLDSLINKTDKQILFHQILMQKIAFWNDSFSQEKARLDAEKESLYAKLFERRKKQSELRNLQRLQAQIIPQILQKARQDLARHYDSMSNGRSYIDHIVARQKRS